MGFTKSAYWYVIFALVFFNTTCASWDQGGKSDQGEAYGNVHQENGHKWQANEPGRELKSKGRRCISPWFIYRDEHSIELLRPNADIIASLSVVGGATRKFVEQCHELGIETYLLVSGTEQSFDTPEHRKETIDGYLRRCQEVGYDGIDLDHEGIDGKFRANHNLFLKEASERLHKAGKKLAICVSYMMSTSRTTLKAHMWDFYDPKTVGETCDMVRVMCYDMYSMSGTGVGPMSTQPWAKDAMKFWLKYVSRKKLIMGLPAYSGDFEMTLGGRRKQVYADRPAVPEGTEIERIWLPYEQINTYRYLDEQGHLHFFFASDHLSTRAHLETVERLDIPGIAFWHYEAVAPKTWKLVRDWHERASRDEHGSWWLVFP